MEKKERKRGHAMQELIGKMVEVGTVGMVYSGRLVEVNESEVHLEAASGWLVVPLLQVVFIREKEEEKSMFEWE